MLRARGARAAAATPRRACSASTPAAASALLLLALLAPAADAAVAARYDSWRARDHQGAYLGCYDSKLLRLGFSGSAAADGCKDTCRDRGMPMYAVNRALQCTCTAALPSPAARVIDDACEAGKLGGVVSLFYIHADKATACTVQRQRLGWDTFDAAYNRHNAMFNMTTGDSVTLRMEGSRGVRVASKAAQRYGVVSFRARASAEPGVITMAYLRSDKHDSKSAAFDEIGGLVRVGLIGGRWVGKAAGGGFWQLVEWFLRTGSCGGQLSRLPCRPQLIQTSPPPNARR
jgi:hypothetical protein